MKGVFLLGECFGGLYPCYYGLCLCLDFCPGLGLYWQSLFLFPWFPFPPLFAYPCL